MIDYKLELQKLTKTFGRRLIFNEIDSTFNSGNIYGISGPNGSGKSTLVKIITGIISPTKGKVIHSQGDENIIEEKLHNYIGFLSPYLILYDEFSAWENLQHISHIRGLKFNEERVTELLEKLNIYNRRNDLLKTYSSGMKQRVKFVFALQHSPRLLILDEPTSNLDEEGKEHFYEIIRAEGKENLVLIASNEKSDLALCEHTINLTDFKQVPENK
jgi:heme exporter protein A